MSPRSIRALVFGAAVAGALLLLAEGVARRVEPSLVPDFSSPGAPELVLPYHPFLLWEHPPGDRVEAGVPVHIDSLGLRGPEPVLPKPPGVRRIVATGDSTVYGFGVPEADMFVHVAASALDRPDHPVEGWAAATPGYSTLQTLNLLQLRALRLEPDVVVIANMWSDRQEGLYEDAELVDQAVAFDTGWAGRLDGWLRRTALYRIAWWELAVQRGDRAAHRSAWKGLQAPGVGTATRVPPNTYARNLEAIVALAHTHGAAVLFVLLPNPEDTQPVNPHPNLSIAEYRRVMRDTAARHGAPVVDGGALFHDAGLPALALWIDSIHPSVAGHHLLGDALAAALAGWSSGAPLESAGDGRPMPTYNDEVARPPAGPPPSPRGP